MAQDPYDPRMPLQGARQTVPARGPVPPVRRKPPKPMWVYKMRRWGAVIIVLALILGFIRGCVPSEHDREMKAWREQARPAPIEQEVLDDVPPSRPTHIRIPSAGVDAEFSQDECRFEDGVIDPESTSTACVYTADDKPYTLPGTTADDIVVLAGRASAKDSAVFNQLYDVSVQAYTVSTGDTMFLKTAGSSDQWLKYQATDLHEPEESGLSQAAAIWGTGPMPGRLLTIICIDSGESEEDADGAGGAGETENTMRNAVIGWQLQGVVDSAAVE